MLGSSEKNNLIIPCMDDKAYNHLTLNAGVEKNNNVPAYNLQLIKNNTQKAALAKMPLSTPT